MKKTKQTMLTAAILSTALAMQAELSYLSNSAYAVTESPEPVENSTRLMAVVGPPPAKTTTAIEITETSETTTTLTEMIIATEPEQVFIKPIAAMYGPPFVQGDANEDNKLNIVDYVMLKDKLMNGEESYPYWREDINQNGEFDAEDLKVFEHYFLSLLPFQTDEDTASVTEPVASETTDEPAVMTPPAETTIPQPMATLYGPPPAY